MCNRRGDARAILDPRVGLGRGEPDRRRRASGIGRPRLGLMLGVLLASTLGAAGAHAQTAAPEPRAQRSAPEPPIVGEGVEGDYLRALHERIHPLWAGLYVHAVAETLPPTNPVNDRSRQAVVLFSVRWDGSPASVILVQESGVAPFDKAARDAILRAERFPVPPVALFSDDGLAHFRWVLARDERLCSGGELHRFEDPLLEAMPLLMIEGRVEEALWRAARRAPARNAQGQAQGSAAGEGEIADRLALFAREWLSQPQADPVADGWAAAVLARTGDDRQIPRLRAALRRRDTVAAAAVALSGLKVEICPLVQGGLASPDAATREIALLALRAGGGHLPSSSPCVQVLGAMVVDRSLDGKQRSEAARALAAAAADGARTLLSSVLKDDQPAVRAAALSLLARPGGGRPALYRWLPYLHDPAIEVRAAAAAALIRSCGDLALDQLVLVWKEPDPQVAFAVANELGRMSSSASDLFLTRLAKRRDPEVRAAVAQAREARQLAAAGAGKGAPGKLTVVSAGGAGTPLPAPANAIMRAVSNLGRREAAEWVLANFDRLDRPDLIEVFASWLGAAGPTLTAPVSAR